MSPVTTIFAREKNHCLGNGSFPLSVDSFLGLWNRTKYIYDNLGRLSEIDSSVGTSVPTVRISSYSYTPTGQLDTVSQYDGVHIDPAVTQYHYDNLGRVLSVTDALLHSVSSTYDALGRLATTTDARGNQTTYGYSYPNGTFGEEGWQVVTVTLPIPVTGGTGTNPVYTYKYDTRGRLRNTIHPMDYTGRQLVDTTQYNYLGGVTRSYSGSASNDESGNKYDPAGNVTCIVSPDGNSTYFVYDALNRRVAQISAYPDPTAVTATIGVGGTGYTNTPTGWDPCDGGKYHDSSTSSDFAEWSFTSLTPGASFDVWANWSSITDSATNSPFVLQPGQTDEQTVRIDQSKSLDTDPTARQYDSKFWKLLGTATVDVYGKIIVHLRADADASKKVVAGSVHIIPSTRTKYAYNDDGTVSQVTDPLGNVTQYSYYDNGWLKTVTSPDPDGSGAKHASAVTYRYDNIGQVVSVAEPYDAVTGNPNTAPATSYQYDAQGNRTHVTDPNGQDTAMAYDHLGHQTSLTDPDLNVTSWTYDALGRVSTETVTLGSTGYNRLYHYDENGNLDQYTDRDGRVTKYVYDKINRMTDEQWMDGSTVIRDLQYEYDNASLLTAARDHHDHYDPANPTPSLSVDYSYTYDENNALQSTTLAAGLLPQIVLTNSVQSGIRTSLTAQIDGVYDFVNSYQYDGWGRMTEVAQQRHVNSSNVPDGNNVAVKLVEFTYDLDGRLTDLDRYESASTGTKVLNSHYVYDSASRLNSLSHSQGATVLADYTFDYNTANRLETFTSTKDAAEGFSQGSATYAYDSAGQLTGTDYMNWNNAPTESYTYDNNGNRTNTGYATGDDNQLASDGTSTYEYDYEGNRTAKNSASGLYRVEYKWDYRNRLEKVTFLHRANTGIAWTSATVQKVVNYTYDEFDRLVHKQVEDFVTESFKQEAYVYDGQDMVLKFARGDENALVASDLQTRYLHGPAVDQILAEESVSSLSTAGNVYWMLGDHDTIRDVADYNSGTGTTSVVNHLQYASFGEIRGQDGTYTPTYTYTGRQYDADSELYYYRARWYDAKVGKFISKDPIGFNAGDANLYRYCGNGPTNYIDPSGCSWLSTFLDGALESVYQGNDCLKAIAIQTFTNGTLDDFQPSSDWGQHCKIQINRGQTAGGILADALPGAAANVVTLGGYGTYQGLNYWYETGDPTRYQKALGNQVFFLGMYKGLRSGGDVPPNRAPSAEVPPLIYREGRPSPSNLTPRPQDGGILSFRDSLSNPVKPGEAGPSGGRPVFRPGEDFIVVDTSKLPPGTVVPDGVPPGHVGVQNVPPGVLGDAVIPKPLKPPYGPSASGKIPKN